MCWVNTESIKPDRYLGVLAGCLVALAITTASVAHRPGFECLDHVIDHEVLDAIRTRLSLSDSQSESMSLHFEMYFDGIKELEADAQSRYEALESRRRNAATEAPGDNEVVNAAITTEAIRIRAEANRAADVLLNDFYVKIEEIVNDEQRESLPEIRRLVRRMNWLHGTPRASAARFTTYFDLGKFYEAALADGGELHGLSLDDNTRSKIESALAEYELAIDDRFAKAESVLRVPERLGPGELPAAFSEKERLVWRCSVYSITNDASTRIAGALWEAGFRDASQQWELRYWRAWAGSLFRETPPERLRSALAEKSIALAPEQSTAIDAIVAAYMPQLHERRRDVFAVATQAMCESGDIIGDEPEHDDVARSILRLVELVDAVTRQLDAVVAPLQVAEIADDREPNRFRSSYLSHMSLHMRIELGLLDPTSYRSIRFNHDSNLYEVWRPKRDAATGKWILSFDSTMSSDDR